jgi:chromosome segregation ATPase
MNDTHDIHNRLLEHDKQLTRLETVLETVASNQADMAKSMQSMATSFSELSSIKQGIDSSVKRIHTRIDTLTAERDNEMKVVKEDLAFLNPFTFMGRYPKITFWIALSLYALAISDIREIVTNKVNTVEEIK